MDRGGEFVVNEEEVVKIDLNREVSKEEADKLGKKLQKKLEKSVAEPGGEIVKLNERLGAEAIALRSLVMATNDGLIRMAMGREVGEDEKVDEDEMYQRWEVSKKKGLAEFRRKLMDGSLEKQFEDRKEEIEKLKQKLLDGDAEVMKRVEEGEVGRIGRYMENIDEEGGRKLLDEVEVEKARELVEFFKGNGREVLDLLCGKPGEKGLMLSAMELMYNKMAFPNWPSMEGVDAKEALRRKGMVADSVKHPFLVKERVMNMAPEDVLARLVAIGHDGFKLNVWGRGEGSRMEVELSLHEECSVAWKGQFIREVFYGVGLGEYAEVMGKIAEVMVDSHGWQEYPHNNGKNDPLYERTAEGGYKKSERLGRLDGNVYPMPSSPVKIPMVKEGMKEPEFLRRAPVVMAGADRLEGNTMASFAKYVGFYREEDIWKEKDLYKFVNNQVLWSFLGNLQGEAMKSLGWSDSAGVREMQERAGLLLLLVDEGVDKSFCEKLWENEGRYMVNTSKSLADYYKTGVDKKKRSESKDLVVLEFNKLATMIEKVDLSRIDDDREIRNKLDEIIRSRLSVG